MTSEFPSSIDLPLYYFEGLLMHGEFKKMISKFLYYSEPLYVDIELLKYATYSQNEFGEFDFREVRFSTQLELELRKQKLVSIRYLDIKIRSITHFAARKEYSILTLNLLRSCYYVAGELNPKDVKEVIQNALVNIIRHIQTNYRGLGINKHAAFRLLKRKEKPKTNNSFFSTDRYDENYFRNLYDIFRNNGIIPLYDDKVEEDDQKDQFVTVFKSESPENSSCIIQFDIDNQEAAYILHNLKSLFWKLTPTRIERSKCFYKKYAANRDNDKKHFKSGSLFEALRKYDKKITQNPELMRTAIKNVIKEIRK